MVSAVVCAGFCVTEVCHRSSGGEPNPWRDVLGGVIRYNALVDAAGQQHIMRTCRLLSGAVAWAVSDCWAAEAQSPQTPLLHGRTVPPARRPQAWRDTIGNDTAPDALAGSVRRSWARTTASCRPRVWCWGWPRPR